MRTAAAGMPVVGTVDSSAARQVDRMKKVGRFAGDLSKQVSKNATSAKGGADKRLRKVCVEMESLLVKQMLTSMRKTIKKSGFIDGGNAEKIFTDMLDNKYAMKMSKSRSFGLAQMLFRQLSGGKKW